MAKKPVKKAAKKTAAKKPVKKAAKKVDAVVYDIDELISAMQLEMTGIIENMEKFNSGNASAGRRIRKHAQTLRKSGAELRKAITNQINQNK